MRKTVRQPRPEQVGRDEQPACQLTSGCRQAHDDPVAGDSTNPGRAGECYADDRQHVGADQRAAAALRQPRCDQHGRPGGQAAECRCHDENRQSGAQNPAAAVAVAEAPGRDEQHREGEPVAGHHPLGRAGGRVQVRLHRRERDVHDEEVQNNHEGRAQQDGKRRPLSACAGGRTGGRRRGQSGVLRNVDVGHDPSVGSPVTGESSAGRQAPMPRPGLRRRARQRRPRCPASCACGRRNSARKEEMSSRSQRRR